MSGIAGVIRLDGAPVAPDVIERMLATMTRRGPDRQHGWCAGEAALGQALLATTPEALAESQPWADSESGCLVVSDSRLDNRPELLQALGISHESPDGIGDGALLYAAYQHWGADCADRLLGDFAFVIWDPRSRSIFCARDIMGVRPFCYHHSPGQLFAFASQTDALLTLQDVPKRFDEGRIADALVGELEGIDNTSTFFQGIFRLPPASTLTVEDGQARLNTYWHPLMHRPDHLPDSDQEWCEALRGHLQEAVRCRLRGSGRVGSMLSGGLDSSSVVALAGEILRMEGRELLPTFSAINSQGVCAETDAIRSVLRAIPTEATCIDVNSFQALMPAMIESLKRLAEPFDGTMMLINAQYISAASQGIRSVMDGTPGDNLYTIAGHVHRLSRQGRWLQAYRESVAWSRCWQEKTPRYQALRSLISPWGPSPIRRLRQRRVEKAYVRDVLVGETLINDGFAQRVGLLGRYRRYSANMAENVCWDPSGQAMSGMTAAYITVAMERYGRVAAFYGVESRHPFLDRRLIEFHAWLPPALRFRDDWPKWAFRQAMQDLLPADVAWRRGKEHLGWRFNLEVMRQFPEGMATVLALANGFARDFLDPQRLESARQAWSNPRAPDDTEALQMAVLTALCLQHHRANLPALAGSDATLPEPVPSATPGLQARES